MLLRIISPDLLFVYLKLGALYSLVLQDGLVEEAETSEIRYKMKAK